MSIAGNVSVPNLHSPQAVVVVAQDAAGNWSAVPPSVTPNQVYASTFGVTGTNDGTRDDAAIIRTWVSANITNGQTTPVTLIMPIGDVWFNSLITGDTDNYDYCVRIDANNFTLVVPAGCRMRTNIVSAPSGTLNVMWKFKAATGTNTWCRVLGDGRWQHGTPGNGNNFMHAIIWGASTGNAVCAGNMQFYGFGSPTVGTVDMSCTGPTRLFVRGLSFEYVGRGFVQSSSTGPANLVLSDYSCKDYAIRGLATSASHCQISNVSIDNSSGLFTPSSTYGINVGNAEYCLLENIKVVGAGLAVGATNVGIGLQMGAGSTGSFSMNNVSVSDMVSSGIEMKGCAGFPKMSNIDVRNSVFGLRKLVNGSVHCTQIYGSNITLRSCGTGLICGASTSDTAEGGFNIVNFDATGTTHPFYNVVGIHNINDQHAEKMLFAIRSADMGITTDQALTKLGYFNEYVLTRIVIKWRSGAFNTACAGGIYTATSKGGTAVLAAAQSYAALTGSGTYVRVKEADANLYVTATLTAAALYFALTTANTGGTGTLVADIMVFGFAVDQPT